jgi:WD40 repeat protein
MILQFSLSRRSSSFSSRAKLIRKFFFAAIFSRRKQLFFQTSMTFTADTLAGPISSISPVLDCQGHVYTSIDNQILKYHIDTGHVVKVLTNGHSDRVTCLSRFPDNNDNDDGVYLVSSSLDGSICFWSLITSE